VRLQAGNGKYKGMVDCIQQTIKHEGFGAFYKVRSPVGQP